MEETIETTSVILDEKVKEFLELGGGSSEFLIKMLDTYLKSSRNLLGLLRETLENNNLKEFKRHVHTLKGSSLNLGLEEMGNEAEEMEQGLDTSFSEKDRFREKIDSLASKLDSVMTCRERLQYL